MAMQTTKTLINGLNILENPLSFPILSVHLGEFFRMTDECIHLHHAKTNIYLEKF